MSNLKTAYDQWHQNVHVGESSPELKLCRWHKETLGIYGDIVGKKILEVGCGRGDFSMFLVKNGAQVHGTDFSEAAIEIAKRKSDPGNLALQFSVADAQNMPFDNNSFDVIFSCECLEHIPDPEKALKEIYRILKPGGSAVITTENYSNGMIILWLKSWITKKPFNSGDEVQPIENFFLFWNVKKMMKRSGFTVKKITGWHYVFFILPRSNNWIVEDIKNSKTSFFLKPFARHMTFLLEKPMND